MKHLYRRCRTCGLDWNVSKIEPGGKAYTCPTCEWKDKLKIRKERTTCSTAPTAAKN